MSKRILKISTRSIHEGWESIAPLATTNISVVICHKQPNWSWQFACTTSGGVHKCSWPLLTHILALSFFRQLSAAWTNPSLRIILSFYFFFPHTFLSHTLGLPRKEIFIWTHIFTQLEGIASVLACATRGDIGIKACFHFPLLSGCLLSSSHTALLSSQNLVQLCFHLIWLFS